MEGATRSNLSYLDKLAKFHRQQGTTLTKPSLDKQPLDLYLLKKLVDGRGGYKQVCTSKKWTEIAREMGYGNSKNIGTSIPGGLKNAYQKYLLPYEQYLEKAKPDFLRDMGLTPSPQQDRKLDVPMPSPGVRRNLMDQFGKSGETDERMQGVRVKEESPGLCEETRDATPSPSHDRLKRTFDEIAHQSESLSTENDKDQEPVRRESKRLKRGIYSPKFCSNRSLRTNHCRVQYGPTRPHQALNDRRIKHFVIFEKTWRKL